MENKRKFPNYFPENCPPEDAEDKEIKVYRLCKCSEKIDKQDFVTYYENNREKYRNNILAYGLSVNGTKEGSVKLLNELSRKSPKVKKKGYKAIAKGITYKSTGKHKSTPNNNQKDHITYWLYENVEPHTYFELCCIDEK